MSEKEYTEVPVLEAWLRMCVETPEFIENYNRLRGTHLSFTLPERSPIEMMVDVACAHVRTLDNDEAELHQFFEDCKNLLLRLPMLNDDRNFQ